MPKKNSALMQKLSILLKLSIFLAKLKQPIMSKLVSFAKTGKLKKFRLLKQYSYYGYVKEFEFSPSSTPLIEFRRKARRNGRISFKKVYSNVFFISKCLGMERGGKKEMYCLDMGLEPLPCIESVVGRELATIDFLNSWSDDESVDERAERFIQRFYDEMRKQRQESNFQLLEM